MSEDTSEIQYVPPPRDWSFYTVLAFVVAPVWGIVPASWSFITYRLLCCRTIPQSRFCGVFLVLAFCECLFSLYHTIRVIHVSRGFPTPPNDVPFVKDALKRVLRSGMASPMDSSKLTATIGVDRPGSPDQDIIRLERNDPRAVDFRNCIRTWFGKVPWSHIRAKEMEAWLYWSFFNSAVPLDEDLSTTKQELVRETMALVEMRAGSKVQDGTNPLVKPNLLTLDPVNVCARPLAWYVVVKIASLCLRKWYNHRLGLRYGRLGDLEYLLRVPAGYSRSNGPEPIIFLHGLGLGVLQYHSVLLHLCVELPDVPLLIPLQPQLSQDIFHSRFLKPMGRHEKADLLAKLLCELGWSGVNEKGGQGVTVLSHSNGSYSHAWLLKSYPQLVNRSCFVDPVTFCTWEGDVCYNFIYSKCVNGLHLLVRYFIGSELGVANLLQRHFDWLHNSLWFEEIPNSRDAQKCMYVLGGNDTIVNAPRVQKYLQSHGVTDGLWFDPNGHHGQALLTGGRGMLKVLEWLKDTPSSKFA